MRIKNPRLLFGELNVSYECAITYAGAIAEVADGEFGAWLAKGDNAGMQYLERHRLLRRHTDNVLVGARSLLTLAFPFPLSQDNGPIASYALGVDYHDELRRELRPAVEKLRERLGGEWRLCVDSAPVAERHWAIRSGLGKPTRSGMVAVRELGTAVFLCELLTTVSPIRIAEAAGQLKDFEEEGEVNETPARDKYLLSPLAEACADCQCCEAACPGNALRNGKIDARRCLSYLTIEHRGEWEGEMAEVMDSAAGRQTLFGCDRCVKACPLNAARAPVRILEGLLPRTELQRLRIEDVAPLDETGLKTLFRGSPVLRAKPEGLRRNARSKGHVGRDKGA